MIAIALCDSSSHLCSMGQHHPNLLFPGTGAEMSQSAHSRCHSWTQPRCPSESCSHIGDRSQESQGSRTLLALNAHTNSWVYKRMEENSCLCHLTTLSYHLCSFCHLQCMGGYRCRCRSLLCSDSWRDHHSQSPEHTHPHLHTHMIKNTHKKGQMGYLLSCQQKQDFLFKVFVKSLSCLCTQTCRRSSSPLAAVGAMHFGVPQQVKASIALIDHGAAGVEVCSLEEAIFQWMRRSTGHTCKTCGNTL